MPIDEFERESSSDFQPDGSNGRNAPDAPGIHTEEATVEPGARAFAPAIRAEIARRITFASHQCDIPVIADLVLSNQGSEDLEDLELRLTSEPEVLGERRWSVDRIRAGDDLRIADRRVSIAGGRLATLNEKMRAEVRLSLYAPDGALLAEERREIVALARNEWGGSRHMSELVAAFVMPNDAAVESLLRAASGILVRSGRPGSLEGYQAK